MPAGDTHLIVSAYLVSYAFAQIPLGYLSEHIGRVKTLYLGLSVFLLGGLLVTFSTSLDLLLTGRFIQGVGGAVGPVLARAIARDISTGAELGKLMALFVSALAVSTMLGPIVGSLLVAVLPWSSVFAASVLFGIICLVLVYCFIPETLRASQEPAESFVEHAREFFAYRPAVVCTAMLGLLFFGYMGFLASFSTIASDQFHQPASVIGWLFAVFVGFYLLGANMTRRLSGAKNDSKLLDLGVVLLAVSVVLFALERAGLVATLPGLAAGLLFYLFALGMMLGVLGAHVLKDLPQIAGTAAGIMGALQVFAGVVGSVASAFLYRGDASSTILILGVASVLTVMVYLLNRRQLRAYPE